MQEGGGGGGGWTFSRSLSPERLAEIQQLIAVNDIAGQAPPAPPAGGGWVFSSELSPESLAEVQQLIAANGLSASQGATASAAAAEEAFARMAAANPHAKIIGEPSGAEAQTGGGQLDQRWELTPDTQGIVAVGRSGATGVVDIQTGTDSAAGDAAFAQMLAANPGAKEVAPGVFVVDSDLPSSGDS